MGTQSHQEWCDWEEGLSDLKPAVSVTGLWKQPEFIQNKHHFLSAAPGAAQWKCDALSEFESRAQGWRLQGELRTVTTSVTSPGATLSATLALTHVLSIEEPVRLHWPPPVSTITHLAQSLPRSLIPTVSAHVVSAITRHACIFGLHFLPLLLPSCCFNSRNCRTKLAMFKDKDKEKRLVTETHFAGFPR